MNNNKNKEKSYQAQKSESSKQFNNAKSRRSKFNGKIMKVGASNAPEWYFKDKQILKDVASFSFNTPLGSRLFYNEYMPAIPSVKQNSQIVNTLPGLMSLEIAPSPGVSLDAQSPFNLAATNVYSYVRYKNSGASNYDAPDLMMYLMAMDSVYSCWNWMKRNYGFASTYSQLNKYEPKAYLLANGIDADDLYEHLADFRAWLNMKSQEISAFCVPATMTYNVRHSWLFSNVYRDADSAKAQQYMYVPSFFYKYDEAAAPTGGILSVHKVLHGFNPNEDTLLTTEDLKSILNELLEALNYSEDIGIMSGDILKAYGESNLFRLSTFDEDYKVEAVYSEEVLTQIENAHPLNALDTDLASCTIVNDPDTNYIQYQPIFEADNDIYNGAYLNFHWSNPTPEDVVVATRLMHTMSQNADGDWVMESCGSEICTGGWVFILAESTNVTQGLAVPSAPLKLVAFKVWPERPLAYKDDTDVYVFEWIYRFVVMHSTFDWHPMIPILIRPHVSHMITNIGICGDFDVYTFISNANIAAINTMALLTEFNVPN